MQTCTYLLLNVFLSKLFVYPDVLLSQNLDTRGYVALINTSKDGQIYTEQKGKRYTFACGQNGRNSFHISTSFLQNRMFNV